MLDNAALDTLFRAARTSWHWQDRPVTEDTLRALYDLVRLGPTSANCSPARFLFVTTEPARERLLPCLSAGNQPKVRRAPVTVIVAYDPRFYDHLPVLYPRADARAWFAGDQAFADETSFRNGTLQGAYLLLAARALGLAAGPMSGFDNESVDQVFFSLSGWKSNFLICLGYPDPAEEIPPRLPRLDFETACRVD